MSERLRLTVSGLSAGYRRRPVLADLSLAPIEAGGITALVGPNGAGKSTLLRVLAGLLPARGSVALDGQELVGRGGFVRSPAVSFMPQSLPHRVSLTVFESVISAFRAAPVGHVAGLTSEAETRALAAIERIGISELALEPLDQLSGGQRQLASLAQAIVREPTVLLLDEPTSSLDLGHTVGVMGLVGELATEGRIVVVVLHDLTAAVRWASRVVVLNRGVVRADGAAEVAMTPDVIRDVYGVETRVERCSRGRLQVVVDGLVSRG